MHFIRLVFLWRRVRKSAIASENLTFYASRFHNTVHILLRFNLNIGAFLFVVFGATGRVDLMGFAQHLLKPELQDLKHVSTFPGV